MQSSCILADYLTYWYGSDTIFMQNEKIKLKKDDLYGISTLLKYKERF